MNNKRYVQEYLKKGSLKTSCRRAAKGVARSLLKTATLAALSLSILGVGEALTFKEETKSTAYAQSVTTDGTTGTLVNSSTAGEFSITGGALRGDSLFHSFDTFSPGASSALFDLSDTPYSSVDNIFSRITGSSGTFIDGLLTITGGDSPNLFLLNPNGISIGPNAALDVPASLFATTAEQISFEDGVAFSALDTTSAPLLTVSAPIGLQFGATAASINWTGNGATDSRGRPALSTFLPSNTTLTLLGEGITIENAGFGTSSGRIQLGSVAAGTQVGIDALSHELTYADDTEYRDLNISRSRIDVSAATFLPSFAGGSGDLSVQGRNINIQSSNLVADSAGAEDGGATDIRASNDLKIADSRVTTTLYANYDFTPSNGLPYTLYASTGRGGNINIEAQTFDLLPTADDGANLYDTKIGADSYSDGSAGAIAINADTVSLLGEDGRVNANNRIQSVRVVSNSFERGSGGAVTVNAENLTISGSAVVSSSTYSAEGSEDMPGAQSGSGGDVRLNIEETLTLENSGAVVVSSFSDGDAGNLTIRAGNLIMKDQDIDPTLPGRAMTTQLSVSSYEDGNGGNLSIETGNLSLFGTSSILASSFPGARLEQYGNGGNVTIEADTISVENGAGIRTSTLTNGDAGKLTIFADEVSLSNNANADPTGPIFLSAIETSTNFSDGTGGDLRLDVGTLTIGPGGQIGAGTFGAGDAGELTVQASDRVEISGYTESRPNGQPARIYPSGIFNSAEPNSSGDGGDLTITTPVLNLSNGGTLSVRTAGSGEGGSAIIRAGEITVADPIFDPFDNTVSGITATVSSVGSGIGGTLDIESDRIRVYNGGQITASSDGAGDAGSILIRTGELIVEGASNITATSDLLESDGQVVSAISSRSTTSANAGSVDISAGRVELRDRGTITVNNTAGGSAGNANIAANAVKLDNGRIQAEAGAGSQGNLNIDSRDTLLLRNGSQLSANATGTATGGNVTIKSPLIVGTDNSDISANAIEGDGGNIRLTTQGLIGLAFRDRPTSGSDITASSELGVSGSVDIESPNAETDSGLVQLPENLEDASNQVVASCSAQEGNQFASTGRGGLPTNPLNVVTSNRPWQDFRGIEQLASERVAVRGRESVAQEAPILQEAGEWRVSDMGEVELLASSRVEHTAEDCLERTVATAP